MNDNVKKVFDMLGVEPYEEFKLQTEDGDITDKLYHIDDELDILCGGRLTFASVVLLLKGDFKIIKLPKKKKLRDLTIEEYEKWYENNCGASDCYECPFATVNCSAHSENGWAKHKNLFSDKFLDQEVEVKE